MQCISTVYYLFLFLSVYMYFCLLNMNTYIWLLSAYLLFDLIRLSLIYLSVSLYMSASVYLSGYPLVHSSVCLPLTIKPTVYDLCLIVVPSVFCCAAAPPIREG